MSWARARHGTAGLTVPQARHSPSKLNCAVPGQESRHGVLARHGTRSRRAVPGHGGTVPCPGVPVPGWHGTPKWTCIVTGAGAPSHSSGQKRVSARRLGQTVAENYGSTQLDRSMYRPAPCNSPLEHEQGQVRRRTIDRDGRGQGSAVA